MGLKNNKDKNVKSKNFKEDTGIRAASTCHNCECQCDSYQWKDARGRWIGNCKTEDTTGAKFCYISGRAFRACRDKQQSKYRQDSNNGQKKWYSYEACATPTRRECYRLNNQYNQNCGDGDYNNGGGNNGGYPNNNNGGYPNNNNGGYPNNNNEDIQTTIMEDIQTIITEDTQTIIMEDTLTIIMGDTQTIIMGDTRTIIMEDTQTTTMEGTQIITTIKDIQTTMVTAGLFSHKFLGLDHLEVIRKKTRQLHLDRNKLPFTKYVIFSYLNWLPI